MIRYRYVAYVAFLLAGSAIGQGQSPVTVLPKAIVVTGSVSQPGVYPVDPSRPPTLLRVLAQSGGTIAIVSPFGFIYRADNQGVSHEISFSLRDVMSGKQPDIQLQAGDVLYIPAGKVPDGKEEERKPIRDLLPPVAERK
jgi:protein involved in polysaccharide export with SLBB domain